LEATGEPAGRTRALLSEDERGEQQFPEILDATGGRVKCLDARRQFVPFFVARAGEHGSDSARPGIKSNSESTLRTTHAPSASKQGLASELEWYGKSLYLDM
jgi:hypothetical protein